MRLKGLAMIQTFRTAALLAAISFGGTSVSAATVTFDFTSANSGLSSLLTYTVGGLTMNVTATGGNGKVQTWVGAGLGAPTDSHHQVDSYGIPETIGLAFSKVAKLMTVTFNPTYVQVWDNFALSQNGGLLSTLDVKPSVDVSSLTSFASSFGIGAVGKETFLTRSLFSSGSDACYRIAKIGSKRKYDCYSAFKVSSVTVQYDDTPPPSAVPLPAGGWMMLASLGGLLAARRRRNA